MPRSVRFFPAVVRCWPPLLFYCGILPLAHDLLIVGVETDKKGKHTMKTKAKKTKLTAAEIKEAIKRDKEWMDNIGPDDEIVVDKKTLRDIFGDDDDREEKADDVELLGKDDAEGEEDEEEQVVNDDDDDDDDDDGDSDDEADDEEEVDDDDVDTSGGGGVLGAIVGGIGGIVLGGILGTALFDD